VILLVEGTQLRAAAHHGQAFAAAVDRPVTRDGVAGRAVIDRATIHLPDVLAADDFPLAQRLSRADGSRTVLATPLIRETVAVGAILIRREEVRPFSDKQISLLQTFADQAVIAIENVRLFNETKEALEQQTATSDILSVISRSPSDVQPVFDAISRSGARLCDAAFCGVFSYDGQLIHLVANNAPDPMMEALAQTFPMQPSRGGVTARTILERQVQHVADIAADSEFAYPGLAHAGFRSTMSAPMLRDGVPLGAITVSRSEARPFTDTQIALLETFADQAVIAIENVRLFTELKASNRDLTTALDNQTATGDILRVISRSQVDVQPVFDAIVASALRGRTLAL
jgi:two-component system, NtrC family, sensor kinase